MKKKLAGMLALCLLLPFGAMAVTEGVVEEAPMVEIQVAAEAPEISYLPDESYYAGAIWEPSWENAGAWVEVEQSEDGLYEEVSQNPYLTAGEIRRAKQLLADYQKGTVSYSGESVLEKMEGVIVGVYALDPADYDGETAYVVLPGTCLTDEQLLSIIAAFDEMGLAFDPESLDYRNCARGGGIETNRFFSTEERERYTCMAEWIKHGKLIPPEGLEGQQRNPELDSAYFCGLGDFSIKPYRSMTDEELVSLLIAIGVHDERGEVDHAAIESRSRAALYKVFGCPLSMELGHVYTDGAYVPMRFTAEGRKGYDYGAEGRSSMGAYFSYHTQDGYRVHVNTCFDRETGDLVFLSVSHDSDPGDEVWPSEENNVTQEKIEAAIADVEARLGVSGLTWRVMTDDVTWTNWGACVPVHAQAAEEWFYTIYIGRDDGQARGWELNRGTLVETLPDHGGDVNG